MRDIDKKSERKVCKICKKKSYYISKHGLCKNCMMERIKFARSQMRNKEGKVYEKWKKNIAKSLERIE